MFLTGKPAPWGPYTGCKGADVWDESCYRHWTIWSFSASGSLSFSMWIKSALFVLQNRRLHAGSAHGIVDLQKLCRRRRQCQICCVHPTSLHPGLHPAAVYYCRPGRLVRLFFQRGRLWKWAQIYLSALWRPNQQEKENNWKKAWSSKTASFLPAGSAMQLLSPACCLVLASLLAFASWTYLHFSLLRAEN